MSSIGVIGLGKMGLGLLQNLNRNNHKAIGFDNNKKTLEQVSNMNLEVVDSLKELVQKLQKPRVVISIITAGKPTSDVFNEVVDLLEPGDFFVDAANSFYKDSIAKYQVAKTKNINFIDAGVSGGPKGALNGACIMAGGDKVEVNYLKSMFTDICVENGFLHTGDVGSGHFAKMVHNGIEYGMMQAIAEGYNVLENSQFNYNYSEISKLWNNGSVIRSWLVELMIDVFSEDPKLDNFTDIMNMNGEGLWTLNEALQQGTPAPVIALSVMMRQASLIDNSFSGKVVSALRNKFGGHEVSKK
ncbi:6-phosphogluconate dehydrogenase [Spiroplasma gladiatoris]|uniref:6-phosphogluconate dehydrogenase n=1 Tax=Spiroplasma gladiatoris TaxID=2143 RepID=A0A4P7AIJ8_9MOLU|nr:decarboxylating 6-phosphogluconate dehydrogenase [Spiroplasma gladiatoris]QBQ07466.1 6-phosphogluconate dehydrogenase [Spiroplasma gladiatoris]